MAPHFGECQTTSMGRLIESLLSTSINSICASRYHTCRAASPVVPFVETESVAENGVFDVSDEMSAPMTSQRARPPCYRHSVSLPANLNSTYRKRKPTGLSISPHDLSSYDLSNPQSGPSSLPAPIYCAKNVEMRRKSLNDRHFFRPVSEDDESFGQ
ncbi:hypothetical protein HJC23_008589 [Cyclotella cryptica]|uniref:Uncharacterized protein n=1 Tax=Cyclotella cryptica TaxID=29204 RepID=A0ABD3Q6V2_9STRA